jgi:hypothetical protein
MPYAKQVEKRAMQLYKGVIDEMFLSRNQDLVIKELLVRADFLKRDFTKRQLNILLFIWTFSFSYGKESALIPQLQDFELCGVSKTKVRKELNHLVDMNVIRWEEDGGSNRFFINTPSEWNAVYHNNYSDMRSHELFTLNIIDSGWDVSKIFSKIEKLENEL